VLAFAICADSILNPDGSIHELMPADTDWILVGIVGIRDEVRPESVSAIAEVQRAGVQVVMITGDRKETACAIAKDAGLLKAPTDLAITSDELAQMSDDEVKAKLPNLRVIARALPSDKSRLVTLTQAMNYVVGMTGDGVNDSPALKKADVGFAMGDGTEVAKEASEIVILDNNFNSIDKAILYGRTIYNSIRKFIIFQLTINVAAVAVNFLAPLFGQENPLTIVQILWINLVMDTLAALAFGGEPALKRFMKEKPKQRDEAIVNRYMWSEIFTGAGWVTLISMLFLFVPHFKNLFVLLDGEKFPATAYFAFFVFAAVFNGFNARTEKLDLFDNLRGNRGFLKVMGLVAVIQILLVHVGGEVFQCHGLTVGEWAVVLLLAITVIPVDFVRKTLMAHGGLTRRVEELEAQLESAASREKQLQHEIAELKNGK
jgi:calcium-translocating P-type ATPase